MRTRNRFLDPVGTRARTIDDVRRALLHFEEDEPDVLADDSEAQ